MKLVIYWPASILLLSFCLAQSTPLKKTDDCKCVLYFMCQNDTIVRDGSNVIDIRSPRHQPRKRSADIIELDSITGSSADSSKCQNYLETCCRLPKKNPIVDAVAPTTAKSPVERKKCTSQPKHQNVGSDTTSANSYGIFPWTVVILKKDKIDTVDESHIYYKCGGALIHPQIVLTTAHCINHEKPSLLQVRAGKWLAKTESQSYQKLQVQNVIIHENFNKQNLHNDFGLLVLSEPVDLTDANVNIVYLAETNENFDTSRCIANGWGKKILTDADQEALKRIELPVMSNNQCENTLKETSLGEYFQLDESFVCAGGELGKDTCNYDGGQPLVCPMKGSPDKYVQAGIVAWGIGMECGQDDIPGVYANVAYARQWINEKVTKAGFNLDEYQCTP